MMLNRRSLCIGQGCGRDRSYNHLAVALIKQQLIARTDAELLSDRYRNCQLTFASHSCELHHYPSLHSLLFLLLLYADEQQRVKGNGFPNTQQCVLLQSQKRGEHSHGNKAVYCAVLSSSSGGASVAPLSLF